MSEIVTTTLECGLVVVLETMPGVSSAAIDLLIPAGSAGDGVDGDGHAALLSELILRGAAGMSSRELSDALDRIGVQRSTQALTHHLQVDLTVLGDRLDEALPLLSSIVLQPALADESIEPVRSLCLQSLHSLDDDPQQLAMLRLRERHRPPPFNRHGYGEQSVLESATGEELREAARRRFVPEGSIFAAAGAIDAPALVARLETLFGGWRGRCAEPGEIGPAARGYRHVRQETSQVHIGLAYDAPPEKDDSSMLERLATAVLSGSTSGRLFTEVRQKRSLCYSVGASYRAGRDHGMVGMYAGTTPERAQETLDVSVAEIRRLRDGVDADEFDRAVVGLKSRLVMHGESTPGRAAALASDHFRRGRARSLDEVMAQIDAVSRDELNRYLAGREIGPMTLVTVGSDPLEPPSGARGESVLADLVDGEAR